MTARLESKIPGISVSLMRAPVISVVIPAFNEENNIGHVLQGTHRVLKDTRLPYEIIVVDDGSTDGTAEAAKEHKVVLIDNRTNIGKGGALRAGFVHAKGHFVVTLDADGSHRPEDISVLLHPALNGKDVDAVVGNRFANHEGKRSTSKLHLFGNTLINLTISLLTRGYVRDSLSGFRIIKKSALRRLALLSSRYEIEGEITVEMLKKGLRIIEVPIYCRERASGTTRLSSFKDGFKILTTILLASLRTNNL